MTGSEESGRRITTHIGFYGSRSPAPMTFDDDLHAWRPCSSGYDGCKRTTKRERPL